MKVTSYAIWVTTIEETVCTKRNVCIYTCTRMLKKNHLFWVY